MEDLDADDVKITIYGGAHPAPPVNVAPKVELIRWRVYELSSPHWEGTSRHFVGWNITENTGRVSSKIEQFDANQRTGITESGRRYVLIGPYGNDSDANWVFNVWCNTCEAYNINDVSEEYK